MKLAGIVLIIIGVLALVYQGFSYTQTEKDAQLGPIEIQHQETHTVPLPPIVGGFASSAACWRWRSVVAAKSRILHD